MEILQMRTLKLPGCRFIFQIHWLKCGILGKSLLLRKSLFGLEINPVFHLFFPSLPSARVWRKCFLYKDPAAWPFSILCRKSLWKSISLDKKTYYSTWKVKNARSLNIGFCWDPLLSLPFGYWLPVAILFWPGFFRRGTSAVWTAAKRVAGRTRLA